MVDSTLSTLLLESGFVPGGESSRDEDEGVKRELCVSWNSIKKSIHDCQDPGNDTTLDYMILFALLSLPSLILNAFVELDT